MILLTGMTGFPLYVLVIETNFRRYLLTVVARRRAAMGKLPDFTACRSKIGFVIGEGTEAPAG